MKTPYDFYKNLYPEQFSDSKSITKIDLNKEMFDYYLETLTSRSQEKEFENFCRKIAEKEICPNLIIQTGPTGGGDSKVDTETYPVSDDIALSWYSGVGREASKERWAFAISAKKDWRSKVKSDVKKIVETGRGYSVIYFMSNQFISDKKRAVTEDELREKYEVNIRILDKMWLLEKVFSGKYEKIAVESFNISDRFRETDEVGSRDYAKRRRLDEVEEQIKEDIENGNYHILSEKALEAAIISRELELPNIETSGRFERAQNITNKYGTHVQKKECFYQWAWTMYWWYMDFDDFYLKYCNFESLVVGGSNVFDLERLTNLWMNLFSIAKDGKYNFNFEEHTTVLQKEYQRIISDVTRPNAAIQAKANYINVKLFMGGDIDQIVDEFIEVLERGKESLDFNFLTIKRIVTELPIYQEAKNYDTLFEHLVSISVKRKSEIEAARLLIIRSEQLMKDKPYTAIRYLGRAIVKIVKDESKKELTRALLLMGQLFESVDLNWAARGYYLNAFHLSINEYFNLGQVNPALIGSLNSIKFIELKLGRLIHSTEFYKLEQIAINLYLSNNPESELKDIVEQEYNYDFILGIQIFRTDFNDLNKLSYFPNYLEEWGLEFSSIAIKYCLGHVDEEFSNSFDNNTEAMEDFITKWYNQPARLQLVGQPWYGTQNSYWLSSKIIGCKINIISDIQFPCIEVGESLLGSIEGFLSTGTVDKIHSFIPEIKINIKFIEQDEFTLEINKDKDSIKPEFFITCSSYPEVNTPEVQVKVKEFIKDVTIQLMVELVNLNSFDNAVKEMLEQDSALDRAINFTGSSSIVFEYFSKKTPTVTSVVEKNDSEFALERKQPIYIVDTLINEEKEENNDSMDVKYEKPSEEEFNIENTKQSDIETLDIINIPLWDKSKWKGVYFTGESTPLPVFSPMFSYGKAGKEIFREWIEKVGNIDTENNIRVGIVKGVNRNKPYDYRVVFTANENIIRKNNITSNNLIMSPARIITMEPSNHVNLNMFIEAYKKVGKYIMFPSSINENKTLSMNKELNILKNEIEIKNAWEIDEESYLSLAILPTDEPVIPAVVKDAPVLKVIDRIKGFQR
ncbi:hypothetical protein GCM10010978_18680 [Compostibacillus humi]|uniref:Uncharacterized protein n=1 Tax=Compostibacillus humi TaxID=1245525 RepID=A0A8J2TLR5_9BACI|nr:hypothetical protein [Compostibacillus humi]GFZ77336.1 hypothetical protein GCM10010978_18680 [Compostibacillus humi]